MITRLKVENFKALKSVDLRLLERNVFIGPNKSGKSSILQVFQLLAQLMNGADILRVFGGQAGFLQWLWKGNSDKTVLVQVWGDDRPMTPPNAKPVEFRYSIECGLDATGNLSIMREFLAAKIEGFENEKVLIQANMGVGTAVRANGDAVFNNPESRTKPFLAYEVPGWEGNQIRKYIAGWQSFAFIPELPRVTPATPNAQPYLDMPGAQLSSWLHTFQSNYPEQFNRVVGVAKEAFPEIEAITVPVSQAGTTFVSTKEKGLNSPISIFYASDGEIKFLQLLSVIFSPFPVGLVTVEEPEDHLHPRLLELLVETANQVRIENSPNEAQLLVTTHSPYLVDLIEPEDVIIVEKHDGATNCTRATDRNNLRALLKESELSFGRLWYSGALGGV